jgi:hypothetical protein
MRERDQLGDWQHRTERVRNMGHRDEARAFGELLLESLAQHLAAVGHRHDDECRTRLLAKDLPRHDIRVVLELGHQDLVAFAEMGAPPAMCDEIDRFGRAAGEHHLALLGGVDEGTDLFT